MKPANFVFVNNSLKLIDFGISHVLKEDQTSVQLLNPIGTLNYMSPEAIQLKDCRQGISKVGTYSDVWSLGCLLYLMVYVNPPYHDVPISNKANCICNPNYVIKYPEVSCPSLIDALKGCLTHDPKKRFTINTLLRHPFTNLWRNL